jgi:hypothetical protein
MKSAFLVVADRGNLKAFRVEKSPRQRPPRLALVEEAQFPEAHVRLSEKVTDRQGRWPVGGNGGGGGGGMARRQNALGEHQLEMEEERRLIRQIGEHLSATLDRENPECWSMAAPATINDQILDHVSTQWRDRLVEKLSAGLVKTPPTDLLNHFSEVRAA